MSFTIECGLDCANHLGEGPVWDVEGGRLHWVDGTGRRVWKPSLFRYDPRGGKVDSWTLDHDVGAMALRRGRAVLALDDGASTLSTTAPVRSTSSPWSMPSSPAPGSTTANAIGAADHPFRIKGLGLRGVPEPRFAG